MSQAIDAPLVSNLYSDQDSIGDNNESRCPQDITDILCLLQHDRYLVHPKQSPVVHVPALLYAHPRFKVYRPVNKKSFRWLRMLGNGHMLDQKGSQPSLGCRLQF
jgi:hypothetical protein